MENKLNTLEPLQIKPHNSHPVNHHDEVLKIFQESGFNKDNTIKDAYDEAIGGIIFLLKKFNPDCKLEFKQTSSPGSRIKQSSAVREELKKIQCEYSLVEWQQIGLDYTAILKVVKWLNDETQEGGQYSPTLQRKATETEKRRQSKFDNQEKSKLDVSSEIEDDVDWQKKYEEIYEKFSQVQVNLEELKQLEAVKELSVEISAQTASKQNSFKENPEEEEINYQEKIIEEQEKSVQLETQLEEEKTKHRQVSQSHEEEVKKHFDQQEKNLQLQKQLEEEQQKNQQESLSHEEEVKQLKNALEQYQLIIQENLKQQKQSEFSTVENEKSVYSQQTQSYILDEENNQQLKAKLEQNQKNENISNSQEEISQQQQQNQSNIRRPSDLKAKYFQGEEVNSPKKILINDSAVFRENKSGGLCGQKCLIF